MCVRYKLCEVYLYIESELQTTCGIYRKRCTIYTVCVRYKRHHFGFWDWDRMAWAPWVHPRPKWYQMIAIRDLPRLESSDGPAVRLIYTRNATKPLLFCPQICHFMRLALLNWGARRPFLYDFFLSLQGQERRQRIRGVYLLQKKLKIFRSCQFLLKRSDRNVHIVCAQDK